MKQSSRKPKILLVALVSVMMLLCGFISLVPATFRADALERQTVKRDLYELSYSDHSLELRLSDDFKEYFGSANADLTKLKSDLMTAAKEIFMANILQPTYSYSLMSIAEVPSFDWSAGKLSEFRDYIKERLSDPDEMDKFVNGQYNALLEYAIGTYVEQKQSEGADIDKLYDDIQAAISDVVETAKEAALNNLPEEKRAEKAQEWEKSDSVLSEVAEKVQSNGGVPSIEAKDIIGAITKVNVNGVDIYTPGKGLIVSGLRSVLGIIPSYKKIANMTSAQIRDLVKTPIVLDTTYGPVEFDLTFGFLGSKDTIQKAAKFAANYFDITLDGNDLTVDAQMPEAFANIFLNITQSTHVSDDIKNYIFDLFNKSLSDMTQTDFEELLGYIKGTDFQYLFANFLNSDFINTYFGNYFEQLFGKRLSQGTIDKIVDKFASKANTLASRDWTYEEALDFLTNNIPGFSVLTGSISESSLRNMVNKLVNITKNIDWTKYDAAHIHETIANSETFNTSVISYIEEFGGKVYSSFVNYFEKLVNFLPETAKDVSLLDMYDGNNHFSHNDVYNIDVVNVFEKISSMFAKFGLDSLSNIFDRAISLVSDSQRNFTVNLSFDMTIPNVYSVKYVAGETVREGFLPVGADVEFFGPEFAEEDFPIIHWIKEKGGDPISAMPGEDVILYAVTEFTVDTKVAGQSGKELNKIYRPDVDAYDLFAEGKGVSYAEYDYEWTLKDDEKVLSATQTYSVNNSVINNVAYIVKVTDKLTGVNETVEFKVNIDALVLNVEANLIVPDANSQYETDSNGNIIFIFDNTEKTVDWSYTVTPILYEGDTLADALIESLYSVSKDDKRTAKDYDTYNTTITFTVDEDYEGNVVFADEQANGSNQKAITKSWMIKHELDVSEAYWLYNGSPYNSTTQFTYEEGTKIALEIGGLTPEKLALVKVEYYDISNNDAVLSDAPENAGHYGVRIVEKDPLYAITVPAAPTEITIVKKSIAKPTATLSEVTYDAAKKEWSTELSTTADGDERIEITCAPDQLKATTKGEKSVTVTFKIKGDYAANYQFDDGSSEFTVNLTWRTTKINIDIDTLKAEVVNVTYDYNKKEWSVELSVSSSDYYTVNYAQEDTKANAAGQHKVTVVFTIKKDLTDEYQFSNGNSTYSKEVIWEAYALTSITKPTATLSEVAYDAATKEWSVTLSTTADEDEYVEVTYDSTKLKATEAGEYTVTVKFAIKEIYRANYQFDDGSLEFTVNLTWHTTDLSKNIISIDTLKAEVVKVTYDYTKKEWSVELSVSSSEYYTVSYVEDDTRANAAGQHKVTVTFTIKSELIDEYQFSNGYSTYSKEVSWEAFALTSIAKPTAKLSAVAYDAATKEWSVKLSTTADEDEHVEVSYDPATLKSKEADKKHTVVVKFTIIDKEHYEFEGGIVEFTVTLEWETPKDEEPIEEDEIYKNKDESVLVKDMDNVIAEGGDLYAEKAEFNLRDHREALRDKFPTMNAKLGEAYEIHFVDGKNAIITDLKDGKFKVYVLIPTELLDYAEDHLAVIHVKSDGSIEFMEAYREGDYMVFEATSFSVYAVIGLDDIETAGLWWLILLIIILAILVLLAILLFILKLLEKNNEEPVEEVVEEQPVEQPVEEVTEEVVEEQPVEEVAKTQPEPIIAVPVIAEEVVRITYNRSFEARLRQLFDDTKDRYSILKNHILSYKKAHSRMSWRYETFTKGRDKICKLQVKGNNIIMYIALDPDTLDPKYRHKSVKDISRYEEIPTMLKIKSDRSLKYAKELVDMVMANMQVQVNAKYEEVDYASQLDYRTTEELIGDGLVKVKETRTTRFWETEPTQEAAPETENGENK